MDRDPQGGAADRAGRAAGAAAGPPAPRAAAPRVALVHHWLTGRRGGERALAALAGLLPGADLFTLVHDAGRCPAPPDVASVRTTALQRWPLLRRNYRALAPLHPWLYRGLDLSGHDLVLTSDAALAKTVPVPSGVPHVCYCYSPPRWAWDLRETYLRQSVAAPLRPLARAVLRRLRRADLDAAQRVTLFIAASHHVRERIERCYGRQAPVAHPPVDTFFFTPASTPAARGGTPAGTPGGSPGATDARPYLLLGEAVAYKRFDVGVAACARMGRPLVVAGSARRLAPLVRQARRAGAACRFVADPDDAAVRELYRSCRALLFPGEEDFGLVPVEAMACGRPVVALGRGGAAETVQDGVTGCLFAPPAGIEPDTPAHTPALVDALLAAMRRFEALEPHLDPAAARRRAESFSTAQFRSRMLALLGPVAAGLETAGARGRAPESPLPTGLALS